MLSKNVMKNMKEEKILEEINKVKYLFSLKEVIRYDGTRQEDIRTESNADHIYGMMILVEHFLPLEDSTGSYDREKILRMTLFHEIAEIETGDINTHVKSEVDRVKEKEALNTVYAKMSETIRNDVQSLLSEYERQSTWESQFVKAVDKFEPSFHIFDENGKKLCKMRGVTEKKNWDAKIQYIKPFPIMLEYLQVISKETKQRGYFVDTKEE